MYYYLNILYLVFYLCPFIHTHFDLCPPSAHEFSTATVHKQLALLLCHLGSWGLITSCRVWIWHQLPCVDSAPAAVCGFGNSCRAWTLHQLAWVDLAPAAVRAFGTSCRVWTWHQLPCVDLAPAAVRGLGTSCRAWTCVVTDAAHTLYYCLAFYWYQVRFLAASDDLFRGTCIVHLVFRWYCPVRGGGNGHSIESTVSDAIDRIWLGSTEAGSCPLG